jgi:RND family efflux transporter MFP subunit
MRGAVLFALLCGAVGCAADAAPKVTAQGVAKPAPAPQPQTIEEVPFLGVILSGQSVEVASHFEGRIERVEVNVGDRVAAHAVLARLDVRALRQELAMAQAALAGLRADRQKASGDLARASDRLARRLPLSQEKAISSEELSTARFDKDQASAILRTAGSKIAEGEASVQQKRAALEDATIRAPFAGQVASRYLDTGAVIHPGTAILRLISDGEPQVHFAVPDGRAAKLSIGQPIEVSVTAQQSTLRGTIESIAPEVDAAANMVFCVGKLDVTEPARSRLQHGLIARVKVTGPPDTHVIGALEERR